MGMHYKIGRLFAGSEVKIGKSAVVLIGFKWRGKL
jgi:hypothetical protein